MSADIILYRLSDAKIQRSGLYFIPVRDWDKLSEDEFDQLSDNADVDRFEDGVRHDIIDLTYEKGLFGKNRGWKRVRDKFDRISIRSGVIDATDNIHKYIVADAVRIYSSWHVLNRKYYQKDTWLCLCTTKEEVVRFFEKYGNKKFNEYKEVLKDVLERWDEKTFLIISY